MKTNFYKEIAANKRKSMILIFFFFIFIIAIGFVVGIFYGNQYFGIGLAFVVGIIYFLFSYYGGANAILTMTKAKEAQKPEYTHLINTVEGIAIAAGIPKPKVYVIKDSALNAFATGRDPKHATVTVTTGLLERMNKLELEGVIAHEIAHIKNYDIRVMMLASVMVGLTVLLSDFILRSFLWGGHGSKKENNQVTIVFIVIGIGLAILSPFIGEAIKLAVSRKREYLADASGAMLTRYPQGLADALRKIKDDPDPLVDHANKATAHLFISTPFRKTKKSFLKNLFSTHPDINSRIEKLDNM
jgi:heat shock protein HtpX